MSCIKQKSFKCSWIHSLDNLSRSLKLFTLLHNRISPTHYLLDYDDSKFVTNSIIHPEMVLNAEDDDFEPITNSLFIRQPLIKHGTPLRGSVKVATFCTVDPKRLLNNSKIFKRLIVKPVISFNFQRMCASIFNLKEKDTQRKSNKKNGFFLLLLWF